MITCMCLAFVKHAEVSRIPNVVQRELAVRYANIKWQQFIRLEQMALRVQLDCTAQSSTPPFSSTHLSPTATSRTYI